MVLFLIPPHCLLYVFQKAIISSSLNSSFFTIYNCNVTVTTMQINATTHLNKSVLNLNFKDKEPKDFVRYNEEYVKNHVH